MNKKTKQRGVVTVSAGYHVQGIADCCKKMKISGAIFMPVNIPKLIG